MITTITNEQLCVSINSLGAAMTSIKTVSGDEFLWSGDPKVWNGQAPNLFPFVGKLKGGTYSFEGNEYKMAKHGFARGLEFSVISQSATAVTFRLSQNESTLVNYPFNFDFDITFSLDGKALDISYDVTNNSSGLMPFSLGAHPAFACNWSKNSVIADYYLEFDSKENGGHVQFGGDCLSRVEHHALSESRILNLSENLFDADALIYSGLESRAVTLRSNKSDKSVRLEFPDFTYLGIWSKPGAPYVCVEPWFGCDDFEDSNGDALQKDGIEVLSAGESFNCVYKIVIC